MEHHRKTVAETCAITSSYRPLYSSQGDLVKHHVCVPVQNAARSGPLPSGLARAQSPRRAAISATVGFAVRLAPIMVAEAKPVQSPYPSRYRRGSATDRVPTVFGTPL